VFNHLQFDATGTDLQQMPKNSVFNHLQFDTTATVACSKLCTGRERRCGGEVTDSCTGQEKCREVSGLREKWKVVSKAQEEHNVKR
jgi:hypothetical protein